MEQLKLNRVSLNYSRAEVLCATAIDALEGGLNVGALLCMKRTGTPDNSSQKPCSSLSWVANIYLKNTECLVTINI